MKSFIVLFLITFVLLSAVLSKELEKDNGTIIGIDLGTTYSCVAVFRDGKVEVIPNDQGNRITPSFVAFTPEGGQLIGDAARNQLTVNPENTVYNIKRLMGRNFDEPTIQEEIKYLPFKVVERNGRPYIKVNASRKEKFFAPEEISAMILTKMKETAEAYLGKKVTRAVVTVPANFNNVQRQATKDAGKIAGLDIVRMINEPTAAAFAYGLNKRDADEYVFMLDLGGGTFDVSLLTFRDGVFEVVATDGDTHLGGEDFNKRVMKHLIKVYKNNTGRDILMDPRAVQKLNREVEKVKRTLSSTRHAKIEIENFFQGDDFFGTLSRATFVELNMDYFRSMQKLIQKVLDDADIAKWKIDEIVLVGGSTLIPKIQELVKDFFNGKKPYQGINPEEAVAYGAAVQAGILSKAENTRGLLLVDITPQTLGLKSANGTMVKLIHRKSVIPAKKSQTFSTAEDNQDGVTIQVYAGEKNHATFNHFLGQFNLNGIRAAPSGVPQVEVTFEINVDGLLTVSARDLDTGNKVAVNITTNQYLTPKQIKNMTMDAEMSTIEYKKVKKRFELKEKMEEFVYSWKTQIQILGPKLSSSDKEKIDKAIEMKIEWLDSNEVVTPYDFNLRKKELKDIILPIVSQLPDAESEGLLLPPTERDEL